MNIGSMPDRFIISPLNGEKFNNIKDLNGKKLIVNTSIENAKDVNRIGIVHSLPLDYKGNILVGDKIIVQHNVFRDYFDSSGKTRFSDWHIKDDLYWVQPELVYLIIRGEEKISVDDFCFIEPIFSEEKWIGKVELQHQGIVKYGNDGLRKLGIFEGDHIGFHNNCEVEFVIDDTRMFKMKTHRILAKVN